MCYRTPDTVTSTHPGLYILVLLALLLLFNGVCFSVQSELVCSGRPVVALAGHDAVLPCHLEPAINAGFMKVVWTKPGLVPKFIHYHQAGRPWFENQNPSYNHRTQLFEDELVHGNVSLKICGVKVSDEGRYCCVLPPAQGEASVSLIVGSVSTPTIKVVSNASGVELECRCGGWYPEPELLWLDAEGNLLPAGPTETVRGSDDLYTVSSRVTVDKRHSSNITCRVQQTTTNQSRQTHIHVTGTFISKESESKSKVIQLAALLCVSAPLCSFIVSLIIMKRRRSVTQHGGSQPQSSQTL